MKALRKHAGKTGTTCSRRVGSIPVEGSKMEGTKVLETAMQEDAQTQGYRARYECEVCGRTTGFKNVLKIGGEKIILCKKHFRSEVSNL